ncbi:alkaline phosphatase family protein [Brevibacillus fluminis]|uniref:Alkaline phosphatase family protein n=1 Tax=Brevibacillus fluminis TaxID=511487 RepID=A0A3M8DRV5_9BACL|nr:alkaline phosphatase family protein [Brevibacillus fluminis]RNB89707.1 alkaline phosphatase family protein [Brevibacillus fluminis]
MNKVIMVVIDGLQYNVAATQMGFINHLVERNEAAFYKVKSELPSMSRPLYEVLLTGTPASVNGITSNDSIRLSTQKSLFHLTKENGLRNAATAFYWVSELYNRTPFDKVEDRQQVNEDKAIQYGTFYFDDFYPDSHLLLDAEVLRRKHDPHFLYIHTMGVDNAGHIYGSDSKQYRKTAINMDRYLAELIPIWMKEGYHIVVTADHGMNTDGEHGGTGSDERDVPLFMISERVKPGCYEQVIPQLAITPLICKLLQIAPSEAMLDYDFSDMIR